LVAQGDARLVAQGDAGLVAQGDARLVAQGDARLVAQGDAATIDVGLAGTVMRFGPAVAALGAVPVRFDGDHQASTRPIAPLLSTLEQLGSKVTYHRQAGQLPFTIRGPLRGGRATLDSQASSQFASALLLVGPALPRGLDLELEPPHLPSRPHVEMTLQALQRFGANYTAVSDTHWVIQPGGLTGQSLTIEPDLSNAAPFLAAAMVAGGQTTIQDWPATTAQPGALLIDYLTQMGASVTYHQPDQTLTLTGPSRHIKGVDLDLSPAGELTPTLAALATLADEPSRLTGIAHLRGHETNRLAALTCEINRLGGQASELPDGLVITPGPLHGATLETYHDHRMATFGAIVGLRVPGVYVNNLATTAKTMPNFPQLWASMLEGGRG